MADDNPTTAEPLSQDKLEAVRMALQMGYPLNADTRAALLRLLAEHRERGKRIAELESERNEARGILEDTRKLSRGREEAHARVRAERDLLRAFYDAETQAESEETALAVMDFDNAHDRRYTEHEGEAARASASATGGREETP